MGRDLKTSRYFEDTVKQNTREIEDIKNKQLISAAGQNVFIHAMSEDAYDLEILALAGGTFERHDIVFDTNAQRYPLATLGVKVWRDSLTDANLIYPGSRNFNIVDLSVNTLRQKKWQVTIRNPVGEPSHDYHLKFWFKSTDIAA